MRRLRGWWKQGVFLGIAGVVFFTVYRGRPEATPVGLEASRVTDAWMEAVAEHAEPGYWLVVRGTHIGDQVVAAASAATLTHAALVDTERSEVIEAVGKGVLRTPLRELVAQSHRLLIIRPEGYEESAGRAAIERARSRVGHAYDWLGTVGMQSDRRFYCTELAVWAWRMREHRSLPNGVIHPEHMERYGEVVFDSGTRESTAPIAALSDDLRRRFASRIDGARGVDYAAQVTPALYRGGVPDADGVEWLKSIGIRTVVNLRHFHGDSEGELVRAAGMRYVRIPLESTDAPEPEQVRQFFDIVGDPEAAPVYVHCLHGVDRTGTMIALYRMEREGWGNTDALAEMEWFGAHGLLHDLRHFVGAYTRTGRYTAAAP